MRISQIAIFVNAPVIHNRFFLIFRMGGCSSEKRREGKKREEKRRDEKLPRAVIINFGANPIRGVLGAALVRGGFRTRCGGSRMTHEACLKSILLKERRCVKSL